MVVGAWDHEGGTGDEAHWTPDTPEGVWRAWNGKAAEVEFVEFAAALVGVTGARAVVETGTGGGYTTRRLIKALRRGGRFACYESDVDLRGAIRPHVDRFAARHAADVTLAPDETPDADVIAAADLLVLDSRTGLRIAELQTWAEVGAAGSSCLIHDVSASHPADTIHRRLHAAVVDVVAVDPALRAMPLGNPRGGVLIWKA